MTPLPRRSFDIVHWKRFNNLAERLLNLLTIWPLPKSRPADVYTIQYIYIYIDWLIDFEIIAYMYFIIFVVGMNMDIVISESSPEKFVSAWIPFVILRISSEGTKLKFREVEVALKICLLNSHLSFNETYLKFWIINCCPNSRLYICVVISCDAYAIYVFIYNVLFLMPMAFLSRKYTPEWRCDVWIGQINRSEFRGFDVHFVTLMLLALELRACCNASVILWPYYHVYYYVSSIYIGYLLTFKFNKCLY